MTSLSKRPEGPFAQNVTLSLERTNEVAAVFGLPVSNGTPVPLLEFKVEHSAQNASHLYLRDASPAAHAVGVSETGPWFEKTRFIRTEIPANVQVPIYLQGQGKLGHVVFEKEGFEAGAATEEAGAAGGRAAPRSGLHALLRRFNFRKFFLIALVVFVLVLVWLLYESMLRKRKAALAQAAAMLDAAEPTKPDAPKVHKDQAAPQRPSSSDSDDASRERASRRKRKHKRHRRPASDVDEGDLLV
jgi:hypothetical protein